MPYPLRFSRSLVVFFTALLFFATGGFTSAAPLQIDINNTGRSISEGLDPGYTAWSTTTAWFPSGSNSISATFSGVTITFNRAGTVGTALQPGYWKEGVQSTLYNIKLTADGIKVNGGDAGAQIEMRIAGLSPGDHTVLLYLNNWDAPTSNAPLDIFVNGTQVVDNLPVSTRVTDNNLATTAYLSVHATAGQDIVVLVKAELSGTETYKNVHLNGFDIDVPNTKAQANNPVPSNGDEHADADTGSITLSWGTAVLGATSHHVYFGTSISSVEAATTASLEFKGNLTANTFTVSELTPDQPYYWRIDEVSAAGGATKGTVWMFRPRRIAFPGAEGYGRFARGGRGGAVIRVTNLHDSGPGSLRAAIEGGSGPRTVIFDVSGLITLNSDIILNNTTPPITIAGQTAPGKGITVKRQQLAMSGSRDTVFRFLRLLVGKESGETQNASGMAGADHSIMDHCSIGWGLDEGVSSRSGQNITFQRCNLSEALNVAGHQNYPAGTAHGYAATISGKIGSFHHNLLAHNEGRNWSVGDEFNGSGGTTYSSQMDIFNNVVYNWGGRTTDGTGHQINFVNNYYKPGPSSRIFVALKAQLSNFTGTQEFYFAGNVMPGYFGLSNQSSGRTFTGSVTYNIWAETPFFPSYATIHTATNAYKQVLSDVGCNQPQIDARDTRIINETLNGTTTYTGSVSGKKGLPDTTNDVGGWEDYGNETRPAGFDTDNDGMPDWWEAIHGTNPNSTVGDFTESNADADRDGYTNLEEYLNWLAAPNTSVAAGAPVDVDLAALSIGYSKTSPSYALAAPINGTVTLVNGNKARFTPSASASALGGFTFTVTDSAGDSMTRTIGVRVLGAGAVVIPSVTLTATDPAAGEYGSDASVAFTISRTGDTTSALTVPLVASGIATSGTDYSGFAPNVTIPAGQSSAVVTLTALPDALAEGAESVTLTLGGSVDFNSGSPASATATISDAPAQAFFFTAIADASKRSLTADADGDSLPNLLEYYFGSDPASSSVSSLLATAAGSGALTIRFPRAKNRPDVLGVLQWSTDMTTWRLDGDNDGTHSVTFADSVVSSPGADPETVEALATISGAPAPPRLFVRLRVQ